MSAPPIARSNVLVGYQIRVSIAPNRIDGRRVLVEAVGEVTDGETAWQTVKIEAYAMREIDGIQDVLSRLRSADLRKPGPTRAG